MLCSARYPRGERANALMLCFDVQMDIDVVVRVSWMPAAIQRQRRGGVILRLRGHETVVGTNEGQGGMRAYSKTHKGDQIRS